MSGLLAIVSRAGAPIDEAAVATGMSRLRHRAVDGERVVGLGWAVLGHAHFWTTPEEVGEEQPLADRSGRRHLAFDGRLDNREEVAAALGTSERESAAMSDAALVLAALERWGTAALGRFVGPFALVLLQEDGRRALLARDTLGDRGLFYTMDEDVLVAASEESVALGRTPAAADLDETRLALHFALREPVDDTTFFRAVKQVLPGHFVLVEAGATRTELFRSLRPDTGVRGLSDGDLVVRYRDLLAAAVACRLRSVSRPGVLLSGGLDSGPIAALAARTQRARGDSPPLALSWVFDAFAQCDERRYIEPIVRQHGLDWEAVACDDDLPLARFADWPMDPNRPAEALYRWFFERSYRKARERGVKVLLSGAMGDALYRGATDWLWSLMRAGRVGAALSGARAFATTHGVGPTLRGSVLAPLLPRRLLHGLRPEEPPVWLTTHARAALPSRAEWPPGIEVPRREGQWRVVAGLANAEDVSAGVYHASRAGVELRYPFRDLRLVEFMLSAPSRLLFSGAETRPIARRALARLLPEAVLARTDKGDFSPLYYAALGSREEGALFRSQLGDEDALWRDYVRPDWVSEAAPGQRATETDELVLWHCTWLELWRKRLLT